jgi:hypothetical protein
MGRLQTAPGLLHYAVNMQTIYMFFANITKAERTGRIRP